MRSRGRPRMRLIDLDEWKGKPLSARKLKRGVRHRPTPRWKLIDSIVYIKMRDEYLQQEGILVRTGERRWKFDPEFL